MPMGLVAGMGRGAPNATPGIAAAMNAGTMAAMGPSAAQLLQRQQQQQRQQSLINAMRSMGGAPGGTENSAFAGLTAAANGFAGMGVGAPMQVAGMGGAGASGLPQAASGMGVQTGYSADQLQSWMQRHNGDGTGGQGSQ